MARIIDARVKQKADTLENLQNNNLKLLDGEQVFVRSDVDNNVMGYKIGVQGKKFSELPYPDYTVRGKVSPASSWVGRQSGVYIPTVNGTYNGISVNLADGYQVLYWDGTTIEKVVYPADFSGLVFGGIIDDTFDLSNPTDAIWYIASAGTYNTVPPITLSQDSILAWDGFSWSSKPFDLEVRGEFLVADNIQEVRNMSPEELSLLVNGTYKGIEVLGYYSKGDTVSPIKYYLSSTLNEDNGASVLEVSSVKIEHFFVGSADASHFGIMPEQPDITSRFIYFLNFCSDNNLIATTQDGYYNVNGASNGELGIVCPSDLQCEFSKGTIFRIIPTRSIYTGVFSFLQSKNVKINILNVEGDKYTHLAPDNTAYKYWNIGESYNVGDYVLNQVLGLRVTVSGIPTSKPELNLSSNPIGSTVTNGTVTFEVVEDVKESGHGVKILNSENITIDIFNGNKCFGDGMYIGKSSLLPTQHNKNITINQLNCIDNRRQGMSVITCDGLYINGGTIQSTKGTNPQAGIDFEPNHSSDVLKNIRILNLNTEDNESYGITLYLNSLNTPHPSGTPSSGQEVDIKIYNHTSVRDKYGFGIRGKASSRIKGYIEYNNAVILNSKLEGVILTDYINQPDMSINDPSIFDGNTINVITEISPAIRHTYSLSSLPQVGDYIPRVEINRPLSRNTNGKTRFGVYVGVAGRPDIAVKNTFVRDVVGEGFTNGGLISLVTDKDIVQQDISQLTRAIPTSPTTFEMTQQQSFKEYNNSNASATNFIMLNPQIGSRRIRIVNSASPTPRILGLTFKDNIGGIIGISQSGTFNFQSNATGAFLDLEYVDGSANLWRIINGGGIWRIVEGGIVTGIANLNGYIPFATTTVAGIVKQGVHVPNGSSIDTLLNSLRDAGIIASS